MEKKSKNTKEAAKIYEYITTVERGLQSTEIIQAIQISDYESRFDALREAGLEELERFIVSENKLSCLVSILKPLSESDSSTKSDNKFVSGELVICIADGGDLTKTVAQLLRLMTTEKPVRLQLAHSSSNVEMNSPAQQEIFVFPTLLNISVKAAARLQAEFSRLQPAPVISNSSSISNAVQGNNTAEISSGNTSSAILDSEPAWPRRIRIIGHSSGGAVGAYLSLILDGFVLPPQAIAMEYPDLAFGRYHNRVKALSLGSPPCLSRSVVPRFISSIVCGDDLIARCQSTALAEFRDKVLKALQSGAGKGGLAGWMNGANILGELSTSAGKRLTAYQRRKKESNGMEVPGRVFFIKSRQLKQGATIQRILRGNWQEDVLWNIHDILISKKMVDHHTLDAYIRTLNRC